MKKKLSNLRGTERSLIKLTLKMKLTVILTLVSLFQIQANTYSQTKKVSLNMSNATIAAVIHEIESLSDFKFLLNRNDVDIDRRVSVKFKKKPIAFILNKIFKGTDVEYEVLQKQIILRSKTGNLDSLEDNQNNLPKDIPQFQVTGTVLDGAGIPLAGANVIEKGTVNGTQTDFDGNFTLSVSGSNAVLSISYVGFASKELSLNGQTQVNVSLQEDVSSLDEVVVVGYGTQKKINQTGSVSSVSFEEMSETRPITDVGQGLAGQAAGVTVTQGAGKPGSEENNILIRGVGTLNNSSPLVVIDGLVGSLSDVVAENIQSISILKDAASASIYGSRAANGVVLVTTKKGTNGKTKFSYNGYTGIQDPTFEVDMVWDYPTHMEIINQAQANDGKPEIFSQATIDDYRAGTDPLLYPNTNWFKHVFRQSFIQRHNLSASGGSDNVRYMFSTNILDNRGSIKKSDYKRYSFRSNVEADFNNWLTAGANVFGYWSDQESPDDASEQAIRTIGHSVPGILPLSPDGRVGGPWVPGENASTNNVEARFAGSDFSRNITKILAKVYATIKFKDKIQWTTSFSPTIQYDYTFQHTFGADIWNFQDNSIIANTAATGTSLSEEYRKYYRLIFDSFITYNTSIADTHNIGVLAGYNQEYETARNMRASKTDLLADETPVFDAASGEDPVVRGNFNDRALRSFFGRINYDYKEKYLLEGNLRYDGSSKFSIDERWGIFPSVSAGWVISKEGFLQDVDPISFFKLKASWGQLGNNRVTDYGTQPLYNLTSYVFGGNIVPGAAPSAIPNDILKWETTTQTDIGFESSFLSRRLGVEFDWFNRRTEDILINLPIPLVNGGLTAPPQNAGIVDNKGFELTLSWRDNIGDFKYGISGNVTHIKNEVIKYLGGAGTRSGQRIIQEGLPINSWYVREVEGIATQERIDELVADGYTMNPMPSPGDFIYKDQQQEGEDGYKVIDEGDRVAKGSSIPEYVYGFSLDFGYKNFDLNILGQGVAGIDNYFENEWYTSDLANGDIVPAEALNAWRPDNQNATFPRLTTGGNPNNTATNDFWLRDASFLRIKNITLGYSLPSDVIQKVGMQRLRLYMSAENYFTFKSSEYVGFDPEITTGQNNGLNYPIMKRLTFGININF
ncbi:TonB-dependent receptor [Flavivirga sp. 57AJ16]|uniref:TonB-dependent receptor n=1 Tax=Flavivirga sp. 57AJ16 TaxID=3025307 RepID=UPI002365B3E6|nr:TonB-dependent receptor [Flavivirga sp. 57AJ16]MDD7885451.1 TonB-dependent receptor [Flavivirga sp. 57AJ16]